MNISVMALNKHLTLHAKLNCFCIFKTKTLKFKRWMALTFWKLFRGKQIFFWTYATILTYNMYSSLLEIKKLEFQVWPSNTKHFFFLSFFLTFLGQKEKKVRNSQSIWLTFIKLLHIWNLWSVNDNPGGGFTSDLV